MGKTHIIKVFGDWLVTTRGVEHEAIPYVVYKDRIWEPDWVQHMGEKNWVRMDNFRAALQFAREYFGKKQRGAGSVSPRSPRKRAGKCKQPSVRITPA
jgi:hypothetical protein